MKYKHNLSHVVTGTAEMGKLYPVGLFEVLPGDIFNHQCSVMVRLAPMQAPVMHLIDVRVHHFFVPHRLGWSGWEDHITGGPDGNDASTVPTWTTISHTHSVATYLGFPNVDGLVVNILPLRAYNLIWNEWFMDQDLSTERGLSNYVVADIAWEKDYYTAARPWEQKGTDVTLPLGTDAPVLGIGMGPSTTFAADGTSHKETGGGSRTYTNSSQIGDNAAGDQFVVEEDTANAGYPNIRADLSAATAAKITDLRKALGLQRFKEMRARFGSRYTDLLASLGVSSPDGRLQRPEYLGGGVGRVGISEVLQTGPDDSGATPRFGIGDLYGHGIGTSRAGAYRRRFREHGYVMSLMSVRPKQMFMDGVDRTFLRKDREDWWHPEFEHIGQQQVLEQELYAPDGTNADVVFGWSDRYQEYRGQRSRVCGDFTSSLDYWTMARKFTTNPVLNESFVTCDATKRIFNDQTTHSLQFVANHRCRARRLVSRTARPRIL